ncbi:hypothetical protein [Aminobacter sp. AP02]|uniref:hypothetical protein n=1 Tax=Aminobacter sp. AP02 TaxID=2135737 RepID=UPI0011B223BE|nr:hypothetical protein [Aminobacter sp. AP02]
MPEQYYSGECSEFLVVPPQGSLFDDPRKQQEMRQALESRFPDLRFVVTTAGRSRFAAFLVIPILGVSNQHRPLPMLRPPSTRRLKSICVWLTRFLENSQHTCH